VAQCSKTAKTYYNWAYELLVLNILDIANLGEDSPVN